MGKLFYITAKNYPPGSNKTFILTNQNGCDSIVQVSVAAYAEIDFILVHESSCPNTFSGTAFAEDVTGGSAPYQYSIDGIVFYDENNFEGLAGGEYTYFIQDVNGCVKEQDFSIEELPALQTEVEEAILPCETLEAKLAPNILSGDDGNLSYLWEDGSTTADFTATTPGTYLVQISNGCEMLEESIEVRLEEEGRSDYMYIPNAFSPNNDGINDEFLAYLGDNVNTNEFLLYIFDRWGNQVYLSEDAQEGWSGKFRGKMMNQGVYIWHLKATIQSCGQELEIEKDGDLLLMR